VVRSHSPLICPLARRLSGHPDSNLFCLARLRLSILPDAALLSDRAFSKTNQNPVAHLRFDIGFRFELDVVVPDDGTIGAAGGDRRNVSQSLTVHDDCRSCGFLSSRVRLSLSSTSGFRVTVANAESGNPAQRVADAVEKARSVSGPGVLPSAMFPSVETSLILAISPVLVNGILLGERTLPKGFKNP